MNFENYSGNIREYHLLFCLCILLLVPQQSLKKSCKAQDWKKKRFSFVSCFWKNSFSVETFSPCFSSLFGWARLLGSIGEWEDRKKLETEETSLVIKTRQNKIQSMKSANAHADFTHKASSNSSTTCGSRGTPRTPSPRTPVEIPSFPDAQLRVNLFLELGRCRC